MDANKILQLSISALKFQVGQIMSDDPKGAEIVVNEIIDNPKNAKDIPVVEELSKIIQLCKEENAKKKGKGGQLSALKRIANSGSRYDGYWINDAGRFCVCSGFHAVRLYEPVDGIAKCEKRFDALDGIISDAKNKASAEGIEPPTISSLKEYTAIKKAVNKKPVPYEVVPGVWVNPKLLIDMIGALPGMKMHFSGSPYNPIYCESEAGDGVLLPVNIEKYRDRI